MGSHDDVLYLSSLTILIPDIRIDPPNIVIISPVKAS